MAAEFLNGNGDNTKLEINVQTETSRKIERAQEGKKIVLINQVRVYPSFLVTPMMG